jgi:hypothetical protein
MMDWRIRGSLVLAGTAALALMGCGSREQSSGMLGDPVPSPIVINEVMAYNSGSVLNSDMQELGRMLLESDDDAAVVGDVANVDVGDYGDWIELYNTSEEDVDLGGYFLSDTLKDPFKAELPEGLVVPAEGYLLIWADGYEGEPLEHFKYQHLPFRLSNSGNDSVVLYSPRGQLVDLVGYPAAVEGQEGSFARYPDGTGDFEFCEAPTANGTNGARCLANTAAP